MSPFHVCLLISRISTLSTHFFAAKIFRSVTPQAKIGVLFHAWNISDFYATGRNARNARFFSPAFWTHACLLISRTGIFFTLKMFLSVTAYASFFLFRFAYFFHACLLFYADLLLCLPLSRSEYVVLIHYRLLKPTFDKDRCLHHSRSDRYTCSTAYAGFSRRSMGTL